MICCPKKRIVLFLSLSLSRWLARRSFPRCLSVCLAAVIGIGSQRLSSLPSLNHCKNGALAHRYPFHALFIHPGREGFTLNLWHNAWEGVLLAHPWRPPFHSIWVSAALPCFLPSFSPAYNAAAAVAYAFRCAACKLPASFRRRPFPRPSSVFPMNASSPSPPSFPLLLFFLSLSLSLSHNIPLFSSIPFL